MTLTLMAGPAILKESAPAAGDNLRRPPAALYLGSGVRLGSGRGGRGSGVGSCVGSCGGYLGGGPKPGGLSCGVGGCDLGSLSYGVGGLSLGVGSGSDFGSSGCGLSCVGLGPKPGGYLGSGRGGTDGSIRGGVNGLHPSGGGGPSYLDACGAVGSGRGFGYLGSIHGGVGLGPKPGGIGGGLGWSLGADHGTSPAGILGFGCVPGRQGLGGVGSGFGPGSGDQQPGSGGHARRLRAQGRSSAAVSAALLAAPMATAVTAALAARTGDMASAALRRLHTAPDITAVCASRSAPATQPGPIQPRPVAEIRRGTSTADQARSYRGGKQAILSPRSGFASFLPSL